MRLSHLPLSAVLMGVRALGICLVIALFGLPLGAWAADDHAVLHTSKGAFDFKIEIVDTDAGREKGLMFRKSLAPDAGMLFDLHQSEQIAFWMKNTYLPLDMVFIRADGTISTIMANAEPYSTKQIPSAEPVRAVLEINGGQAGALGIRPGDHVLAPIFGY